MYLCHRLAKLTEEMEDVNTRMARTSSDQQRAALDVNKLTAQLTESPTIDNINKYVTGRQTAVGHNSMVELRGKSRKFFFLGWGGESFVEKLQLGIIVELKKGVM